MPPEFRRWKLSGSKWAVAHFLAAQAEPGEGGRPCCRAGADGLAAAIAADTGWSTRTVEDDLKYFVDRGLIAIERRRARGEDSTLAWIRWGPGADSCAKGIAARDPAPQSTPRSTGSAAPAQDPARSEARGVGDGAESCAIQTAPDIGLAPTGPLISPPRTNVNVFSSIPGLGSKTSTLGTPGENPPPGLTGFEGQPDAEVYAYLAPNHVFCSARFYTPALRELAARKLPIPGRYEGKALWVEPAEVPRPEVVRYSPPAPGPKKDAPPPTLEQRIARLHKSGDLAEAEELGDWMFKTVGEKAGNVVSARFHRRNMREVAAGDMPPKVLVDELKAFRAGEAEDPLRALTANIKTWREEHGLAGTVYRKPRRRKAAQASPAAGVRA